MDAGPMGSMGALGVLSERGVRMIRTNRNDSKRERLLRQGGRENFEAHSAE